MSDFDPIAAVAKIRNEMAASLAEIDQNLQAAKDHAAGLESRIKAQSPDLPDEYEPILRILSSIVSRNVRRDEYLCDIDMRLIRLQATFAIIAATISPGAMPPDDDQPA